jgi:hypothetical protein
LKLDIGIFFLFRSPEGVILAVCDILAVIEFAVDDDSDSDAPAYVHEDGVFQAFALSLNQLSESHAPGIVLDTYR